MTERPGAPPTTLPAGRLRVLNRHAVRTDGDFVLYWMTAFRRMRWNHALDRAVELSAGTGRPLVVLEALNWDYPWASARMHRFIMDGMAANARRMARTPGRYYPYVEPARGAGRGLLRALADRALAVVVDDWPGFFQPRLLDAAGRLPVRAEAVDSSGLLPVQLAGKAYPSAHGFRRFLQRELPDHLAALPSPDPLADLPDSRPPIIPPEVERRWPATEQAALDSGPPPSGLAHDVAPVDLTGGSEAGRQRLDRFVEAGMSRYADERSAPEAEAASGLSPYLHFGHVSPFEILARVADAEGWSPDRVGQRPTGRREGWWGMGRSAEAFLDELVTWRELGLNGAVFLSGYDAYEGLPEWARKTLAAHEADPRPYTYDLAAFDEGRTHDSLWNAAQRQLRVEGGIQNYLRMLWGKKILEWSPTPRDAAEVMVELNNRYALDGRDPNSYSGIFWCLGRYDRPWGPERPIFGTVRYMSSANTARKFRLGTYLDRYGARGDVEQRPLGL